MQLYRVEDADDLQGPVMWLNGRWSAAQLWIEGNTGTECSLIQNYLRDTFNYYKTTTTNCNVGNFVMCEYRV